MGFQLEVSCNPVQLQITRSHFFDLNKSPYIICIKIPEQLNKNAKQSQLRPLKSSSYKLLNKIYHREKLKPIKDVPLEPRSRAHSPPVAPYNPIRINKTREYLNQSIANTDTKPTHSFPTLFHLPL